MSRASAARRDRRKSTAARNSPCNCCASCSYRSPSTRTPRSRRSTPSWRRAAPVRRGASATPKSSSCRWTTAFASAPANADRRPSDMPDTNAPLGILLSDDLIFTSRVTGEARALGFTVKPARSAETLLALARQQPPACILIDLANPGLSVPELLRQLRELCTPLPRVVAYGSHVDAAGLRAAREAGCDPVLPRSKFVEELPVKLPDWLRS